MSGPSCMYKVSIANRKCDLLVSGLQISPGSRSSFALSFSCRQKYVISFSSVYLWYYLNRGLRSLSTFMTCQKLSWPAIRRLPRKRCCMCRGSSQPSILCKQRMMSIWSCWQHGDQSHQHAPRLHGMQSFCSIWGRRGAGSSLMAVIRLRC